MIIIFDTPIANVTTSSLWYHGLFHPSNLILNKVAKEVLRTSFDVYGSNLCTSYLHEKVHKLHFIFYHIKSTKTFSIIYVDLCTSLVLSVIGAKYNLSIVDNFSWYIKIYFLATKDQSKLLISMYKEMVER